MAGIVIKSDSCTNPFSIRFCRFFYALLFHEKVLFFLVSIYIRMSLSTLTRQSPTGQKYFQKKIFTMGLTALF